jgi:hypothetical protein
MILTNKEIEELIGETELCLGAARKNPKINANLLRYKFDETRLAVGDNLLQGAMDFYQKRIEDGGQQPVATSVLEKATAEVKPVYREHLTIGRLILKHEPEKLDKFSMAGERKRSFNGWVSQGRAFYTAILANADMTTAYDGYGITVEQLQQGLDMMLNLIQLNIDQEGAKSTAQIATELRDNAVDLLADWLSEFKVILRLACADEPQLLEAAGIVVKST